MKTNYFFEGIGVLPRILSKEEMNELLLKSENGDINAQNKIIEHNIRLVVARVSKRFQTVKYDKNDLVSIGCIGLTKATKTFKLEKNSTFSTYAAKCIDNEILMFLREIKQDIKLVSIEEKVTIDKNGNALHIKDILKDDTDILEDYIQTEKKDIVQELISQLPEREREIIKLYFGFYDNKIYSQKEISAKFNLSQSYISRLIIEIVKNLQNSFRNINAVDSKKVKEEKPHATYNAKRFHTIYEYFSEYSTEEINKVLENLPDNYKKLITLKYGKDLNNPQISNEWNSNYSRKFYGSAIPKIKSSLLQNRTSKILTKENSVINILNKCQLEQLEIFKDSIFRQVIEKQDLKEKTIAFLFFGYISDNYYSLNDISNLLKMSVEDVTTIIRKILLLFKKEITNNINIIDKKLTK